MKKILSVSMVIILLGFSFWLASCSRVSTVKVKANKQVVELAKSWGSDISFYTAKKNPLKSTEGLRQVELGCYDRELVPKMQAFYKAAEVHLEFGEAVQVIGPDNPIFSMERGPRLYLTSAKFAKKLKDAAKVEFTE
jgi:hypothetical protein